MDAELPLFRAELRRIDVRNRALNIEDVTAVAETPLTRDKLAADTSSYDCSFTQRDFIDSRLSHSLSHK